MSTLDKRIAEWLFLLTFAVAAYFFAGGGWNQNVAFDVTRALVERHTFAIDSFAGNTGDVAVANGHYWANKPPVLSVVAAVPYAIVHAALGVPRNAIALGVAAYVVTVFSVGIFAAFIPWMLYRELRRRGCDAVWSAGVAIITVFATEILPYTSLMMVGVPAAMLLFAGYTARRPEVAGFATAAATAMFYFCGPALLFFLLARRREGWARFVVGALPPLVALLVYQRLAFGGFFTNSLAKSLPAFHTNGALLGLFVKPSLTAFLGITVSPYRGLFFFAPVLVFAVFPMLREWPVLAISIFFVAANTCFNGWHGGFGVGARYLVPLIPLWGLALAKARPRALVVAAALLSFAINFVAVAVDPQPSNDIPRPLTQYLLPLFVHGRFSPEIAAGFLQQAAISGHTSVNRMTYDELQPLMRHSPHSPESEWASFNLGELLFGPGDVRSVIPVALLLAGGCAAILVTARRVQRASAATPTR